MGLAGLGGNATQTGASASQNTGNTLANIYQNAGNSRASAYTMQAVGVNNALQGGLQNWMFNNYLQSQPSGQQLSPYGPYATGYKFPGQR